MILHTVFPMIVHYRSGTVNSKSFVNKDFLGNNWKYELTMHFKHEMIGKHFTETSNKVELRINRIRINRSRRVLQKSKWKDDRSVKLMEYRLCKRFKDSPFTADSASLCK